MAALVAPACLQVCPPCGVICGSAGQESLFARHVVHDGWRCLRSLCISGALLEPSLRLPRLGCEPEAWEVLEGRLRPLGQHGIPL